MNAINSLTDSLPNELSGNLGKYLFAYTKPEPRDGRAGPAPEYPYPTSLSVSFYPLEHPFGTRGGEDETQAPSTDQAVRTTTG